jgi:hypothetical protein
VPSREKPRTLARGVVWGLLPLRFTEAVLGKVIGGKDDSIRLALVSILARGHLLIEGFAGVAVTYGAPESSSQSELREPTTRL